MPTWTAESAAATLPMEQEPGSNESSPAFMLIDQVAAKTPSPRGRPLAVKPGSSYGKASPQGSKISTPRSGSVKKGVLPRSRSVPNADNTYVKSVISNARRAQAEKTQAEKLTREMSETVAEFCSRSIDFEGKLTQFHTEKTQAEMHAKEMFEIK